MTWIIVFAILDWVLALAGLLVVLTAFGVIARALGLDTSTTGFSVLTFVLALLCGWNFSGVFFQWVIKRAEALNRKSSEKND